MGGPQLKGLVEGPVQVHLGVQAARRVGPVHLKMGKLFKSKLEKKSFVYLFFFLIKKNVIFCISLLYKSVKTKIIMKKKVN